METRAQQNTSFLDQSWKYILKRLLSTTVEDFINRKAFWPFFPSSCHSSAYFTMLASAANRWIGKQNSLIASVWGYCFVNHDRYDLPCSQHNNASVTFSSIWCPNWHDQITIVLVKSVFSVFNSCHRLGSK